MQHNKLSHAVTALLAAITGVTAGTLIPNETPEARATVELKKRHAIVKEVSGLHQSYVENFIRTHVCPEVNAVYKRPVCFYKDINGANLRWINRDGQRTLTVFAAIEVPGKWSPQTE